MILKLTEKNSFVISINDKRYKLFKKIFNYYQLLLPKLFNGVKHNNPVLGCLLSHYNILKLATLWSLPYIFVFEDDVLPNKNIIHYLNEALKNVPDNFNILKLENIYFNNEYDNNILSENNWIKHCKNAPIIGRGTGAIVINITSSFQLIKLIEKMIPNITPIDVILELANKIFHNFNMYISKNILFVQHNLHKEKTIHNNFMNNSLKRINPNLGIISDFEPNIFE